MKKALLIVDPQIDFISGTLPVPGAQEGMDRLSQYVKETDGDYALKIVTLDWHPYDHSSFAENGGPWPMHCVQHTEGAAVYRPLLDALYATSGDVVLLTKGTDKDVEEYSIFRNPASAAKLVEIIESEAIDHVDICGLAGDVCVLNTTKDALPRLGENRISVLEQYSPSLDGGTILSEFIKEKK